MRPNDLVKYNTLTRSLDNYAAVQAMPGITSAVAKDCFIRQIIDSIRRIEYIRLIKVKNSPISADPQSIAFDPLKAAAWHASQNNIDEAFWLIFLSIHFGRNKTTKWNLVRDVYSGLGNNIQWDWQSVSQNPAGFRVWLNNNELNLKARGKVGNHRKYQSLGAYNNSGTGAAVESYVNWIGPLRSHQSLINQIGNNPKLGFKQLYRSMNNVMSFGRMAKFDYLTMVGKFGLINIEPDSTYMQGATGPVTGAKLLFGQQTASRATLDNLLINLEGHLGLYFGMQVLEDAVCNWQKSPNNYRYFGG